MVHKNIPHKKLFLICGLICVVCGLVIVVVSVFYKEPVSYSRIGLGIVNIIYGGLFTGLGLQNKVAK